MAELRHFLILGGTGFVGSALVRQLRQDPEVRLTLLVHRRTGALEASTILESRRGTMNHVAQPSSAASPGGVPPPEGSAGETLAELAGGTPALRHDGSWSVSCRILRGSLAGFDLSWMAQDPPACVIHLARLSGNGRFGRLRAGCRGFLANRRLLRALQRLPHPPRLVYVSGSLMYGGCGEEWVDERAPLRPTSFARQYILGERPFLRAQIRQTLPILFVRPPWILGADSWFEAFFLKPMREQRAVPLYGTGENWMTFLHVEDCAMLIRRVATAGTAGATHNVYCHPPLRQRELVQLLAERTGLPIRHVPLADLRKPFDPSLAEAFGSSIRLRSRHESFLAGCTLKHPHPADAIASVLEAGITSL